MLDLNRANFAESPISLAINELIERAEPHEENVRQYLGASAIGSECLRRIQFDWLCTPELMSRTRDIFRRGHLLEELSRQHFIRGGFTFAPAERVRFSAVAGLFRGHADGILIGGPALPGVGYPCVWEHKALNDRNWRAIEREGLEKSFAHYVAQVALYQAYLGATTHPAIFTALNANTCERVHLLLPFDAERAQAASDRAVRVIEATRVGELLPRLTDDRSDWRCRMCSHLARCWGAS
jgi:hypothetical protein